MAIQLPSDPNIATKVLEAESQKTARSLERGLMGIIFGIAKEKPGNIAGFAIIVSCGMIVFLALLPPVADFPKKELITLFGSIITSALGYVFGAVKND